MEPTHIISRRAVLRGAASATLYPLASAGWAASAPSSTAALGTAEASPRPAAIAIPPIRSLVADPVLARTLYSLPFERVTEAGAAGRNVPGYQYIEYQRQGCEMVTAGIVTNRPNLVGEGWKVIDWGFAQQKADGGFDGENALHSASLFLEAAARAMLIDPKGVTPTRKDALRRGAAWHQSFDNDTDSRLANARYTHRRYIVAACLGQIAELCGDAALQRRAQAFATEGLFMQRPDGTNPEKGGFDASYQMAGVLFCLRFLPVCSSPGLRDDLIKMIARAVPQTLSRQQPDGSVDVSDSTRMGHERAYGQAIKTYNYRESVQVLTFGARILNKPEWLVARDKMIALNHWDRKAEAPTNTKTD